MCDVMDSQRETPLLTFSKVGFALSIAGGAGRDAAVCARLPSVGIQTEGQTRRKKKERAECLTE